MLLLCTNWSKVCTGNIGRMLQKTTKKNLGVRRLRPCLLLSQFLAHLPMSQVFHPSHHEYSHPRTQILCACHSMCASWCIYSEKPPLRERNLKETQPPIFDVRLDIFV